LLKSPNTIGDEFNPISGKSGISITGRPRIVVTGALAMPATAIR